MMQLFIDDMITLKLRKNLINFKVFKIKFDLIYLKYNYN